MRSYTSLQGTLASKDASCRRRWLHLDLCLFLLYGHLCHDLLYDRHHEFLHIFHFQRCTFLTYRRCLDGYSRHHLSKDQKYHLASRGLGSVPFYGLLDHRDVSALRHIAYIHRNSQHTMRLVDPFVWSIWPCIRLLYTLAIKDASCRLRWLRLDLSPSYPLRGRFVTWIG